MDKRTCIWCKETKSSEEFTKTKKTSSLKQHYRSYCKPCYAKYSARKNKEKYQDPVYKEALLKRAKASRDSNKLLWIDKLGGCCFDCKHVYPIEVYDFHHLDPSKKEHSPGDIMYKKDDTLEQELTKCILLCANCHRIRHTAMRTTK